MSVAAASSRFVFPRRREIVFHQFSDGVAVYDEADGSVYALSPVAGEVLGICSRSAVINVEDVSMQLELDHPTEEELDSVAALLVQFESMGLLERVAV